MKKILATLAVFSMITAANYAKAEVYSDVAADHWANTEISAVVKQGILPLVGNAYLPEEEVSRSTFNSALLRTLGHRSIELSDANPYSDVYPSRSDYGDILLSSRLGLFYGYNDGTFKPDRIMTKAEAASVISHITKDYKGNTRLLNAFKDKADIPSWDVRQFAKTIDLDIYVNYPNADELLPNKNLNKAEAAVLLYKLKNKLDAVQEQYVSTEVLESIEHLNVNKKAAVDEVQITNQNKVVLTGNILKGYFATYFSSQYAEAGDVVTFKAKKDVYTEEGTLVIPEGTEMIARITSIIPKKWWNKNDKLTVEFEQMVLPNGISVPFSANILNNDGILTENRWVKPVGYTVGGAVLGGGVGVGIASFTGHHHYGKAIGAGIPIGATAGLITGLVTPGRTFKANDNEYVWLELTSDLVIPN